MTITDEMIERAAKALWEFWNAEHVKLGASWDVAKNSIHVTNMYEVEGARAQARAALTAALGDVESLEDVLKPGMTVVFAGRSWENPGGYLAAVNDDNQGQRFAGITFEGKGPTIDAAIRNAVAAAKGEGR